MFENMYIDYILKGLEKLSIWFKIWYGDLVISHIVCGCALSPKLSSGSASDGCKAHFALNPNRVLLEAFAVIKISLNEYFKIAKSSNSNHKFSYFIRIF